MGILTDQLRQVATAVAGIGDGLTCYSALADDELLAAQSEVGVLRRNADKHAAWIAGEIARRSSHELGYAGLAQRTGFHTPEALIQSATGSTRTDAAKLVRVGTIMAETEAAVELAKTDPGSPFLQTPWLATVAAAVTAGTLSVDAAEAIRKGLGEIDPGVPAEKLTAAAEYLLQQAAGGTGVALNADQVHRLARRLRDELDQDGILARAKSQHDDRYFKIWRRPDGMYQVNALFDPEAGLLLQTALDAVTSPRRGGPRFVDPTQKARAQSILDDERTTEQIRADTFLALVHAGINVNPDQMLGKSAPSVRVMVTDASLHNRAGRGYFEGHPDAVPLETVERQLCAGYLPIVLDDDGQCLNVGRDQRLFTPRQRVALAVRDGGCLWPGCVKPASWSEAHHIDEWVKDGGKTDIADGVLLCRHHHMMLHNNHWSITRRNGDYYLRPPVSIDPDRVLRPMPSKNPLITGLVGTQRQKQTG